MTASSNETATADTGPAWHTETVDAVVAEVRSDPAAGLSRQEAGDRLLCDGPNELPEQAGRSLWDMVVEQFKDVMILLLLAAAVISGIVGDAVDTIAILVIIVLNATIGVVQGYRAEKAIEALRAMASPRASVVRDGTATTVPSADVVVGDLVLLEAGGVVPADLRLSQASRLQVAEAALTGESVPVDKATEPVLDADAPLGDRACMAFRGTEVTTGRGAGLVVATGPRTQLGQVAGLLAGVEDVKTPLQRRLAHLSKRLAMAVVVICAIVFVAGLWRGEDPLQMLLTAVSLAVAAVPEALPAVVTISLALGASAMVRQNALVRRLPAVETLGSVTYICSDKTGTLTQNRMTVDAVWTPAGDEHALVRALAACNDATIDGDDEHGDPTEVALVAHARKSELGGTNTVPPSPRRVAEIPFDADRRRMVTVHESPARGDSPASPNFVAYAKGAPEALLALCSLDDPARAEVEQRAGALAESGLRVLAAAQRSLTEVPDDLGEVERGMTLLGLVGLLDPPRPEAADAVAECRAAGIVPVMITGDHPDTAHAIAARVGIAEPHDVASDVLTGRDLTDLDDATLAERALDARVYARVDPAQKIRIVQALQATRSGGRHDR